MAVASSCIRVTPCLIVIMNSGLAVMYVRLVHLAVCIVGNRLVAIATFVSHKHLWASLVEMASVVVRVHCKRPVACFPCHGAIEMAQGHILVILPAVQNIAKVCVTAIPPDTEHISVSVQAH